MKAFFSTFLIFCLWQVGLTAQDNYANSRVLDPRSPWISQPATIEEAIYTVRPQGLFTEVGVYLTFSARRSNLPSGINLEAVLYFSLPEEAIVNDSWLWIDTVIIKGELLDRWTANTIYEDIVDRNQDPSILFKNGPRDYELRIFPMASDSSRRVKLNFLLPGEWSSSKIRHYLPIHLGMPEGDQPPVHKVRYFYDPAYGVPEPERPEMGQFTETTTPSGERIFEMDIQQDNLLQDYPYLVTQSPMSEGYFLQTFQREEEQFYELALEPERFLQLESDRKPRHTLILLQFNPDGTAQWNSDHIRAALQQSVRDLLTEKDSFAVLLSGLPPKMATDGFLPASGQVVDQTFSEIDRTEIGSYNLPGLLQEAIHFIRNQGKEKVDILLVANAQDEGDLHIANELLADLEQLATGLELPFYVADVRDKQERYWYYPNGDYSRGNSYFYNNLIRVFGGVHVKTEYGMALETIRAAARSAYGRVGTYDIYTSATDGFCYQRYTVGANQARIFLDDLVVQRGKFVGKPPFLIELAVETEGDVYLSGLSLSENNIFNGQESLPDAWMNAYLKELSLNAHEPGVISQMIDLSIRERILSVYTAFICLEPAQGGEPCSDCVDESRDDQPTATTNPIDTTFDVALFPNPFRENLQLSIATPKPDLLDELTVEVVNNLGQVVQRWVPSGSGQSWTMTWNGVDLNGRVVPSGLYHVVLQANGSRKSFRVIKQ